MQDQAVLDFHSYKEYSTCIKFPSDKMLPGMMQYIIYTLLQ